MRALGRPLLLFAALVFAASASNAWAQAEASIVDSPHNLSVTGPGPIRSPTETEVCIFCHIPHRAGVTPLWNRELSQAAYITYRSPTAQAIPGQPTGASKLCLSCHDGTIALGRQLNQQMIAMSALTPQGRKNLGTDLSDDHPISIVYQQAQSANPRGYRSLFAEAGPVHLDENGMVQCTSCHDPHNNVFGDFLVMDNREGRLCLFCHEFEEWSLSSHHLSTAFWNGAGRDPWPNTPYEDVRSNACANCHEIHDAGGREHLLYFGSQAETCFTCHNGSVASVDVRRAFEKPYRHRVESAIGARPTRLGQDFDISRVTCGDCHNPHAANTAEADPPFVSGALKNVAGITGSGALAPEAQFQYEICYKCHSMLGDVTITRAVRRASFAHDLREKFDPGAVSFHPVEAPGKNVDVPSLVPPWSEASLLYCTHCHSDDVTVGAGFAERQDAPHGSNYPNLLVLPYETMDNVTESEHAYALCYRCHDRLSILSNQTFAEHASHIVDQRASCAVCHDPHGISRTEGTPLHNAHLINFDVTVVRPDPVSGRLEYNSEGFRRGSCFLLCHGQPHSPESY